ncbi:alpha-hydroxy acid oxidase [Bradyrhizobium sp. Tv2a-2]|uniref:alpha-hydroxy acid oxidase n=1 Tax=Bradyrhizobium sp. Tv2a-2 TaxID=113395 RepID=UPI000401828A|nr:alpha-hydroxy acid oxidase [Bradyrhizobium sp. Tv2a-2]
MALFHDPFGPSPPMSTEDYTKLAKRKLPTMTWPYLSSGADDLVTIRDNREGFRKWRLRVRTLTGANKPELKTNFCRTKLALPLALAPTGMVGLAHWTGDVAVSKAAELSGTRHVLSTAASYSIEEVAEATELDHWFQLYPFGDRDKATELMNRAASAGYTALFVTVDVPILGNREAERRSGMTIPAEFRLGSILEAGLHPAWWWNLLVHRRTAPIHYVAGRRSAVAGAIEAVRAQQRYMQGDLNWDDVAWMRDHWKGPFYVKGIMDADDAAKAVDEIGADGVVVSNHGGRQLDSCQGAIDALPAIVDRVGNRCEVLLDGGVRRGSDVIIALALGAKGVFIGRPYVHALAVGGEKAVRHVIDIFREELHRNLILMGCPSVAALDRSWLIPA